MQNTRQYISNILHNSPILISTITVFIMLFTKGLAYRVYISEAVFIAVEACLLCIERIDIAALYQSKKSRVLLGMLSFSLFVNFYYKWISADNIPIIDKLSIDKRVLLIIIGVLLTTASSLSVALLCDITKPLIDKIAKIVKARKKELICINSIYSVGIIALIRSNYMYRDDMGRVLHGYSLLGGFSRYLAEIISNTLHTSGYLTDISPLPQIVALLVVSLAGIIIIDTFQDKDNFNMLSVISLIPIGLSPFFLMCLSYKYDSIDMGFSILFAVLPIAFTNKNKLKYLILVALCTIAVCTTYQAASGIFPILVIFMALIMWKNKTDNKSIVSLVVTSAIGYIGGMLYFRLILMDTYSSEGDYVDTGVNVSNTNLFGNISNNLKVFIKYTTTEMKPIWIALICVIVISFLFAIVSQTRRNKVITCLITLISLVLMYIISYGAYIIINEPLLKGRCFYTLGILLSLLLISISESKKCYIGKLSAMSLCVMFFIFAFTYGNALNVQKEYAEFRTEEIVNSLKQIDVFGNDEIKYIKVHGDIGYAPAVENMIEDNPALKDLVYSGLQSYDDDPWSLCLLQNYYGLKNIKFVPEDTDFGNDDLPVIDRTIYHTLSGIDNTYVIELYANF